MSTQFRIGLLGLGNMGAKHLKKIAQSETASIGFVYDIHPEKTKYFAEQYQTTGVFNKAELKAHFKKVDGLIIATPTTTHFDYVMQAFDSVQKIFVEKPLTENLAQAQKLLALAKKTPLALQVGFIERFNPAFQSLYQLLSQAENHSVIQTELTRTTRATHLDCDVDVVLDMMVHDIDLALYLHGPIQTVVHAHGKIQHNHINFACAILAHQNGTFSRIIASKITDKKTRRIEVMSPDRFIECDLLEKTLTVHGAQSQQLTIDPTLDALYLQLNSFVQPLFIQDPSQIPLIEDSVKCLEICEQIQAKIYNPQTASHEKS